MITCNDDYSGRLRRLLARYRLRLEVVATGDSIPGSFWGVPEAGLVGMTVYTRADTPLHSALHETAHVVCMDPGRRAHLHTDAGGEYAEEAAVCYLQVVLARELGVGAGEICADMDAWGYTFRLGSAYSWFTCDAADARAWLTWRGLLTGADRPTWRCRGSDSAAAQFPVRRSPAETDKTRRRG